MVEGPSKRLLSLEDLSIYLKPSGISIVSGINLSINEKETFSIVGESGSGKTMTALAIMGILPENISARGRILLNGINLLDLTPEEFRRLRGKRLSMIFQEPMTSLNPVLTVGYQVSEVLITHLGISKKEAKERTIELFRQVNIPSPERRYNEYPHQLSGGLRQRVMIAMAIACNPSLLIADEPTTALDVTIQAQILELLDRLKEEEGLTVLLITHDLGIVRQHSERVAVMYAGTIMELTDTEELFRHPLHPYTLGLINSLPDVIGGESNSRGRALKPIPGSIPSIKEIPKGCRFSPRCYISERECETEEPPLREVMPGHFVRCRRI